jgi:hypothetical protein
MDLERVKMAAFFDELKKLARAKELVKALVGKKPKLPSAPSAPAGVQSLRQGSPIKLPTHAPATRQMPGIEQGIARGGIGRQTALGFV